MSLENISAQISSIHSQINGLNQSLQIKREQFNRLIKCEQEYHHMIGSLESNYSSIRQPELSGETWTGSNADEFRRIREQEIIQSFKDILDVQSNQIESRLSDKINQLRMEVGALESQISYQRSRLYNLQSERRTLIANG